MEQLKTLDRTLSNQQKKNTESQNINTTNPSKITDITKKRSSCSFMTFQKLIDDNKPIPELTGIAFSSRLTPTNGEQLARRQRRVSRQQHQKSVFLKFNNEKPLALVLKEIEADYSAAIKYDKELLSRIDSLKMDIEELEFENSTISGNISKIQNKVNEAFQDLKSVESQYSEKLSDIRQQFNSKLKELHSEKLELENELNSIKNDEHVKNLQNTKLELLNKIKSTNEVLTELSQNETVLETKSNIKRLKLEIKNMEDIITAKKKQIDDITLFHSQFPSLQQKYLEQLNHRRLLRRKLNNKLLDLKGTIRVFCRIRPPTSSNLAVLNYEVIDSSEIVISNMSQNVMQNGKTDISKSHFCLDQIFEPQDTNSEIFEEVSQLIQSFLDGNKVCIFAYGQTGSGKTYTMSNPKDGIIPRSINFIFNSIKELESSDKNVTYVIFGEFLEIYNESIIDLLDPKTKHKYEIRHNADFSTTINNLREIEIKSVDQFNSVLNKINKVKKTAFTNSNENSSRSHTIFRIKLKKIVGTTSDIVDAGLLSLIDLAGSERVSKSKVDGIRLKEAAQINKSLSCLGDVIHSFGSSNKNKNTHIPFRNSKLTYLLQNSFNSNNCKTLMLVTISADAYHISETVNSLRFAMKVNSTNTSSSSK